MDKALWEKAVAFHGHECPGLAIGVRASEVAMQLLETGASEDESVVCVTENDACGVDGVQAILSCTIGKGNLLYRDTGKQAFSFFARKSGKKIRLVLKTFTSDLDRPGRMQFILNAPYEEVFIIGEPKFELPETARIFKSVKCEICGESAPDHKMRLMDGKTVCMDCFAPYSRGW